MCYHLDTWTLVHIALRVPIIWNRNISGLGKPDSGSFRHVPFIMPVRGAGLLVLLLLTCIHHSPTPSISLRALPRSPPRPSPPRALAKDTKVADGALIGRLRFALVPKSGSG